MFRDPICAVTVSVDYAGELDTAARYNRPHFDRWVVVTEERDVATREVCRRWGLTPVLTEAHRKPLFPDPKASGPAFAKGRAVARGLTMLPAHSWVVHLDADTVIPRPFRHAMEAADLRDDVIYGADRVMVETAADFARLEASGWLDHMGAVDYPHTVTVPKGFTIGSRWVGPDGWVPIGYFQMWHRTGSLEEWRGVRQRPYPDGHGTAAREDVQMSHHWDRRKRELLPELLVVHIGEPGRNWSGRVTKPFGAVKPVS